MREGRDSALDLACIAYAEGAQLHPQRRRHGLDGAQLAGPTGYGEREWVATPDGTQTVVNHQAFAWNPSIRGGKAEDTVLLRDGKIEWLTATPELPVIEAIANSTVYPAAGVLIK